LKNNVYLSSTAKVYSANLIQNYQPQNFLPQKLSLLKGMILTLNGSIVNQKFAKAINTKYKENYSLLRNIAM